MSEDLNRMRRIIGQHAETVHLMGVDWVPVRKRLANEQPAQEVEALPNGDAAFHAVDLQKGDERAARQRRLDAVRAQYERDAPHERFITDFTNIVFGEGDPCARLMFVGEAPGADEDKTGRPFVGKAGQLLEKMINAMGLRREDVYICNVLKTRPPNNQTPTTEEARACEPYLHEQIRIVSPEVIVTLGLPASRLLLGSSASMGQLRGRWAAFPQEDSLAGGDDLPRIDVMPTYHPAFLLRSYTAENRRKVWSDLQQVMEKLGLGGS